jgi:hypothetical protein
MALINIVTVPYRGVVLNLRSTDINDSLSRWNKKKKIKFSITEIFSHTLCLMEVLIQKY